MFSRIERCGSRACRRSAGTSTTPRRMTSKGWRGLTGSAVDRRSSPRSGLRLPARMSNSGSWPWPSRAASPSTSPGATARLTSSSWRPAPTLRASSTGRSPIADVAARGARLVAHDRRRLAEHRRDDLRLAALAGHERGDVATVAQHGAHVAVLAHLGEAVGDEQHRAVALLPPAHHGEHPLGQVGRQGGGDLVEEQQLRVERQRAGEVEHAQERQRHVAHLLAEVEAVEVHRGELRRAPRRCRRR